MSYPEEARDIVTDCFLYLWGHRHEVEDRNIKDYLGSEK